jgi:glutathione S-transferase
MASYLAFNDVAALPIANYPQIAAWYARIAARPAWADPFAGLDTPPLPPISC